MIIKHLQTDLLIIGGGINGTAIAADAAGRGLSVILCEKNDLASGTSSASTKLIHGGLRYLEQYDFKLVREALREREILLKTAAHLVHPLEFILPYEKNLRPAWMIQCGLFLYDHLYLGNSLPRSKKIKLDPKILKQNIETGFSYFDCQTDDARLVIANAQRAASHGALILPHTECVSAQRHQHAWQIELFNNNTQQKITVTAKVVINAAGPYAADVLTRIFKLNSSGKFHLDKGSHIVVPKLYPEQQAYLLQNNDGRVIFVIPYQDQFSLIGTTDNDNSTELEHPIITPEEINYLCNAVNNHFSKTITPKDIVWSYSGVRALYDVKNTVAAKLSREYHLDLNTEQAPLLTVYGGKLTTFRSLAEHVLAKLKNYFPKMGKAWTANTAIPGSDFNGLSLQQFIKKIQRQFPELPKSLLQRYVLTYGSNSIKLLNNAQQLSKLGQHFGADLYESEIKYLIENEWAQTANDILWRRTKLGLMITEGEKQKLICWLGLIKPEKTFA